MRFFWDIGGAAVFAGSSLPKSSSFVGRNLAQSRGVRFCGREEPVEADFVEPPQEHMLKVAADKLLGGKLCGLPLLGSPVLVAEGHSTVLKR